MRGSLSFRIVVACTGLALIAVVFLGPGEGWRRGLWFGVLVVLLLTLASEWRWIRMRSGRVRQIRSFARGLATGVPTEKLDVTGADDLAGLARDLRQAGSRMDQALAAQAGEQDSSAAILRSMSEAVAVVNERERVVFCNPSFAFVSGAPAEQLSGRPLAEILREPELLLWVRQARVHHAPVHAELSLGTGTQTRHFSVTAVPVAPSGAAIVLHEITELRRLELVRRDFVANVSHELRTPLTAIQGFAETLLAGGLEDEVHRRGFVEIIQAQATRLARLTEDLLELSRLEAGRLELRFQAVDLEDVLRAEAASAAPLAAQRGLDLGLATLPSDLPSLRADPDRIRQVLRNLVDNALQYTPRGGRVTLDAEVRGADIILSVSDTGIGIPDAERGRIFERFYRVDSSRAQQPGGGTGLGLAIARHLVELHGGHIGVESDLGIGSRFFFSLPLGL